MAEVSKATEHQADVDGGLRKRRTPLRPLYPRKRTCAMQLGMSASFIQRALGRGMTPGLRDHRDRVALFKRLCSSRAELCESIGPQRVGSYAI